MPRRSGPVRQVDSRVDAARFLSALQRGCYQSAQTGLSETHEFGDLPEPVRVVLRATVGFSSQNLRLSGEPRVSICQTWFPGLWYLRSERGEAVEVGAAPRLLRRRAHIGSVPGLGRATPASTVADPAPRLLDALLTSAGAFAVHRCPKVFDVTDRPMPQRSWLAEALGVGSVHYSRDGVGGTCRIVSTAEEWLWRMNDVTADGLQRERYLVTDLPPEIGVRPEQLFQSGTRLGALVESMRSS